MSLHARAWRWLAGPDGTRPGLPIAELLAPLPLAAVAVLVANDWWWKPAGALPPWLTGKVSDVAGVFVLPLVLTAVTALVLRAAARLGAPVDWTLRRRRLAIAIAVTAALLAATKLSPAIADQIAALLGARARIVADPGDLVALPVLAGTWLHGRRTLARVAHGRLAWIAARRVPAAPALADAVTSGADPARIAALAVATDAWVAGGPAAPVDAAVAALRR